MGSASEVLHMDWRGFSENVDVLTRMGMSRNTHFNASLCFLVSFEWVCLCVDSMVE